MQFLIGFMLGIILGDFFTLFIVSVGEREKEENLNSKERDYAKQK